MAGFIDIHQHIAYGIDDGAKTLEDSLAMARSAQADGISYIIATAHAVPSFHRFPLEQYYRHVDELNNAFGKYGIGVSVYEGCEIFFCEGMLRQLDAGWLPTLARSRYVLIEFDPTYHSEHIIDGLRQVSNAGYIPIIAHVERYESLLKRTDELLLARSKFQMRIQMNCSTLIERIPRPIRRFRDRMLDEDAIDYLATDAHNVGTRSAHMSQAYEWVAKKYGVERAISLTRARPREIFLA